MPLYEVGIYNQCIRNYTRSGLSDEIPPHFRHIDIAFDSVLYFDREARNEQVLAAKLEREFPKYDGYIIEYTKKVND